ncbi:MULTISPECIES: SHOCT domain-containing protein [Salinibaculum]|uniref:SHOCT domain-containing protein n=1 Tax=Salinibaculum TaxID=2732368 RepID=UPI0030D41C22
MPSRHRLYFGGFVVTAVVLVGVGLLGLLEALSVLTSGLYHEGEFVLVAVVAALAEWVFAGILLGLLAVAFLVGTVVSLVRAVSLPRSARVASVLEFLEYRSPTLARLELSARVEPTVEDRTAALKSRYVAGELGIEGLERELARVLDDDASVAPLPSVSERHASVERET